MYSHLTNQGIFKFGPVRKKEHENYEAREIGGRKEKLGWKSIAAQYHLTFCF